MNKFKLTIFIIALVSVNLIAQDLFVRSAVIPVPAIENGGFGDIVSGVDFDGDGNLEIYAVNDNWGDSGAELIPRIYKYEFNGTTWDSVWSATLDLQFQNTWPAVAAADLDNDGKMEIVWGPVNNFGAGNENPTRFVVFETVGDGSDNMGVDAGGGNWAPNAEWNAGIVDDNTNMRPIRFIISDVDNDGVDEIMFPDRGGYYYLGVVSVDDIPDAGGGTETWTMEFSGKEVMADSFVRNGVIDGPDGSFGGAVSGMDFDSDGLTDLYAVNDNWNDGPSGELVPTLFKYELVSGAWVLRWSTVIPGMDYQNTWPVLTFGDWDNDGKGDIQWTPINNFGTGNEDPDRIVVYETPGDGSDEMGVDQGDGTWAPNAGWNMDVPASTSMRPFRGQLVDIDGDGALEFVFAERHNYYVWGVVGVSDIPDAGDGSETWTMEGNGVPDAGSDYRDLAVIDQTMYLFGSDGDVRVITNDGTTYTESARHQAYPGWSWLSASTYDVDDDGTAEIVTGDYLSGGSGSVWVLKQDADTLVGYAIADFSANTANRITSVRAGLVDGDTLVDFVVGFRGTDEIYLVSYQGGDITSPANYTIRLLDSGVLGSPGIGQMDLITLADIDADGKDEVFYSGVPRSVAENTQPLTVGDFGTWTMEGGSSRWDIAYANDMVYAMSLGGSTASAYYDSDTTGWKYGSNQTDLLPGGSFKSLCSGDVDGDGIDEIFGASYSSGPAGAFLLKYENGGLVSYKIADLGALGADRLTGGAAGDIDGDGMLDVVFGTRASVPNNSVYRVEYRGGDMTDMSNWSSDVIDSEINAAGGQLDIMKLANMDEDADLEVVYSGIPRGGSLVPIVILDVQTVETTPIDVVKVDSNGDFVPDNLGQVFTIVAVVTTPDFNGGSMSIFVQDETAGINIYASVDPAVVPSMGDLVQITGTVLQYNGLTELELSDADADILVLGTGTVPSPHVLTIYEYITNGEMYEGSLIKINAIAKLDGDWPAAGSNGYPTMWDGAFDLTMKVDKDTDIADNPEPVYPMNAISVAFQNDYNTPPDGGYQMLPRYYTDFEQGVAAPPSPYFFFTDETAAIYDGQTVQVTATDQQFTFVWHPAVDLNGDNLIYQMQMIVDGTPVDFNAADTFMVLTGQQIITALSNTNQTVDVTLRTKGAESALVSSVDTLAVTFDIVVGVDEENMIPKEFFVDQNYPNPFNPSTTIQFGLPQEAKVNLVIYDILGREVAVLIDNEFMSAGVHQHSFDASRLASGTYIYRLHADQKVQTKKMLLLK